MKNLILFIALLIFVSSCGRKANQQSQPIQRSSIPEGYLTFSDSDYPFAIDSLPGYSLRSDGERIDVLKEDYTILSAIVMPIDSYYLPWAKRLDSTDIGKGFVFARALTGAAVEDAGGGTKYSIDSTYEYRNKFNARCFRIWIKGISYFEKRDCDTSYYQGYFVDMSQGDNYKVMQIPNTLDFLDNKTVSEVCRSLANSIKVKP
jgi:hypothetical protein